MLFLLRMEFLGIGLEEIRWFHRVGAADVVEGKGGDVVGLSFLHQGIIFE